MAPARRPINPHRSLGRGRAVPGTLTRAGPIPSALSRHPPSERPWLAAAPAEIYTGFGHVYLREWIRAVGWFGLIFAATALALPGAAVPGAGGSSVAVVMQAADQLPTMVSVALLVLRILNTVDAYRLVKQRHAAPTADSSAEDASASTDANRCPHCGRETDPEFDFCQWCGEPISADS